jgi:hypothetical protein
MSRLLFLFVGLFFIGCTKEINCHDNSKTVAEEEPTAKGGAPKPPGYASFTIRLGQHYCDQNSLKSVRTSEMKFMVKFDNSAIYQTVIPENQYDINKLWGFSEGINNQYNSARIGWSWNNDALRLYGYVYANGVRHYQEITSVIIGTDITCSIKLAGNTYLFTVNGVSVSLPRGPSTTQASGYQQYPYFGGDETAPHLITIMIKPL